MKRLLTTTLLLSTLLASSQETLKSSDISQYAYPFEISNKQIVGKGADTLITKISKSQFFLLGEQHFSPQISELTEALIPELKDSGYKYFAVETGPHSAKKITDIIETKESLFDFNAQFHSTYKSIPFPFFDGIKDEVFLKKALKKDFVFWGIDQEYLSSHLFLIDDIYDISKNKNDINVLYLKAKQYIENEFKKYKENEGYGMFNNLLKSEIINTFFKKCKNKKQIEIINDLRISWKIYALYETKDYLENTDLRMRYMKQKFGENYFNSLKEDSHPKVVVKMGSMHLATGKNWLNIYDLGNAIKELSYLNGTKSTSVNCFARYWIGDDGKTYDYLNKASGKDYQLVLELAQKNKWVLIDSKPILDLVRKRRIELNKNLQILLSGFDYVLFSPTKTIVKPNFSN
ncbi:hypothetical protein [Yeosuana marina]|uniref:hypothetical protein n=1 Tax=Yeosuana marina TaxID=1565536 RepID=UPI00141E8497|nr:hypothetical protein [Yeosuana marina]